jgi:hypothetical protein
MGIMSNKVTRRVALGSIAAGLGGTALVLRALKARYDVAMPSGTGTVKVTRKYRGRDITVDVPLKRPSTPQEKKEIEEQIMEQLKKNPTYIEVETQEREKFRDERRKEAIRTYDELEKRELADLAKKPYQKEEKKAAAKAIKEYVRACKARALDHIDKLARDDIARLSKP